jgi:pimeloyl-ACP methyl ester carboxylesterase
MKPEILAQPMVNAAAVTDQPPTATRPRHATGTSKKSLWKWGGVAAAGAAMAGAALFNHQRAKRAERDNPPLGRFITVDGVKLHYLERGKGEPLVLLHGNGTMIQDWLISGVLDALAQDYRVIAFDRPGFGYSERPRSRIWTPAAQAALLAQALDQLEIGPARIVGHSFGTMVSVALGLDHPAAVKDLVLLGGYYYPSVRPDVLLLGGPAIPGVGDVMRYTISPLLGAAMLPGMNAALFSPARVSERWSAEFPFEMSLRPSQIRAAAAEADLMIPAAAATAKRLGELTMPVAIVAGRGDKVVFMDEQTKRLHAALPHSRLTIVEEAGHMVHHTAPGEVLAAIRAGASR